MTRSSHPSYSTIYHPPNATGDHFTNTLEAHKWNLEKICFTGMGISIIKIRRSWDRLIFIMGIPILIIHLYLEMHPWTGKYLSHKSKIFFMRFGLSAHKTLVTQAPGLMDVCWVIANNLDKRYMSVKICQREPHLSQMIIGWISRTIQTLKWKWDMMVWQSIIFSLNEICWLDNL